VSNIALTDVYKKNVKAYNSKQFRYIVNKGGTSCFFAEQLIITKKGLKKISEIKEGDLCLSYNEELNIDEWKRAISLIKEPTTDKCYKITLKNGKKIIATKNHKFYYKKKWFELKDLLSLLKKENGTNMEINP